MSAIWEGGIKYLPLSFGQIKELKITALDYKSINPKVPHHAGLLDV